MAHFAGLVAAGLHPNPVAALRLRHLDDAQDARRAALGVRPLPRGARAGARPRRLPRDAGRSAQPRDRREGGVLPDRRVGARSATTSGRCARTPTRWPRRSGAAGSTCSPAAPTRTSLLVDLRAHGVERQGRRGAARRGRDHGQPQHRPVRRAAADRRLGLPRRDAGDDDARLRRGRLPRGRRDHRATRSSEDADICARSRARSAALCRAPPALSGPSGLPAFGTRRSRGYDRRPRRVRHGLVTEVTHPLVQHKLGLLRDVTTTTQMFRQLVNELTLLLTYEATKDLADEEVEIETPLERTSARRISGKKVAVCPILRAGMGMLDARALARPGRARRLHRPLPRRGDARAGRVLREAAGRHRRPRRHPARSDARDRELDRRRGRDREARRGDVGASHRARSPRPRASRASTASTRTCTSSSRRSTAG